MTKNRKSQTAQPAREAESMAQGAGLIEKPYEVSPARNKSGKPKPLTKLPDGPLGGTLVPADKIAADTARYEALAREHGADLSEEGFNEALRKVGRQAS